MKHRMVFRRVELPLVFVLALTSSPAGAQRPGRHKRTVVKYEIPDVTLLNQDREKVRLKEAISDSNKPVMVDFIYGTCTTICPVLSAGFSHLQRKLGAEADTITLISISIDPEHDTPEIMKEYLEKYQAKPGWDFITGSRADIDEVMRAFDAYVPDKMSHRPLRFLKSPGDEEWIRIDGLISTRALLEEYEKLIEP